MVELETVVLKRIKEWITQEEPKPGFVDGPWQIFARRLRVAKGKSSQASIMIASNFDKAQDKFDETVDAVDAYVDVDIIK